MKHNILLFYTWLVRTILFFLPDIPIIMRFRGFLYGLGMRSCGTNFQVAHDTIVRGLQNLSIGKNVFIGNHTVVAGTGILVIEDNVLVGPHVVIITGNHTFEDNSYRYGAAKKGEILIQEGCWITSNCTIGINSVLPKGSVLSANSFLNKKHEISYSVYGGVPAKFIKQINF